jgi:16S rRNA (guanine527-N7)-methyltransferase
VTVVTRLREKLVALQSRTQGALVPADAEQKLLAFIALLSKWNAIYNLTAIREPDKMLTHHILDALAAADFIQAAGTVLDVGAGAGLPGIPIAIVRPDCRVTLIDANAKKTAFCEQARIELNLNNVAVVTDRVEQYRPEEKFAYVISRAFSNIADFIALAGRHLAPGGLMLAMKGVAPRDELDGLPSGWQARVQAVSVPGLAAERCVVMLTQGH